jgi:uracil phosphoribosyltransferase
MIGFVAMLVDTHYLNQEYRLSEITHHYGKNVHILSSPYLFSTLAKLCSTDCKQPVINQLLDTLYRQLVTVVVNNEFPLVEAILETRMASSHPEAQFRAKVVDPSAKVVCVNLARAGTVPSQICFDAFNYLLKPDGVRQDHISINRRVDTQEKVIGTNLGGLKIGGNVDSSFVVFPDPMGATGSTITTAMEIYQARGKATKWIAIHLIVTPEYLAKITRDFPNLLVYAIRLDRGLSSSEALKTVPGTKWESEHGLNSKQYIVPGGGGLGEVINNAYV